MGKKEQKRQIATARSEAVEAKQNVSELRNEFNEYKRQIIFKSKLKKSALGLFFFLASLSSDFICNILKGTRWFSFSPHEGYGWVSVFTGIAGIILIIWGVWGIDKYYKKD